MYGLFPIMIRMQYGGNNTKNTEITRADAVIICSVTTCDREQHCWWLALLLCGILQHTKLLCVSIRNATFSASQKLYCRPHGTICIRLNLLKSSRA